VSEVKKRRGFAAMDPARVRELAALGGREAHARGKAYCFSGEKAREAGRKGGMAPHATRGPTRSDLQSPNASSAKDDEA